MDDFMGPSGESVPDNPSDDELENTGNSSRGGILGFFFS
jgi:hypothetical protein